MLYPAVFACVACVVAPLVVAQSWPMFRHDTSRSGYSNNVAGPSGAVESVWNFTAGAGFLGGPAVSADGTVVIGSYDNNVYAIDGTTGAKKWSYTTGDTVQGTPTVVGDVVFIGSYDYNMYALNLTTGAALWSFTTTYVIVASPLVSGNAVYFGADGMFYALNATSGALLWKQSAGEPCRSRPPHPSQCPAAALPSTCCACPSVFDRPVVLCSCPGVEITSSAALYASLVVFGSQDGNVYALDAATGKVQWTFETQGKVQASPAVSATGTVYVGRCVADRAVV